MILKETRKKHNIKKNKITHKQNISNKIVLKGGAQSIDSIINITQKIGTVFNRDVKSESVQFITKATEDFIDTTMKEKAISFLDSSIVPEPIKDIISTFGSQNVINSIFSARQQRLPTKWIIEKLLEKIRNQLDPDNHYWKKTGGVNLLPIDNNNEEKIKGIIDIIKNLSINEHKIIDTITDSKNTSYHAIRESYMNIIDITKYQNKAILDIDNIIQVYEEKKNTMDNSIFDIEFNKEEGKNKIKYNIKDKQNTDYDNIKNTLDYFCSLFNGNNIDMSLFTNTDYNLYSFLFDIMNIKKLFSDNTYALSIENQVIKNTLDSLLNSKDIKSLTTYQAVLTLFNKLSLAKEAASVAATGASSVASPSAPEAEAVVVNQASVAEEEVVVVVGNQDDHINNIKLLFDSIKYCVIEIIIQHSKEMKSKIEEENKKEEIKKKSVIGSLIGVAKTTVSSLYNIGDAFKENKKEKTELEKVKDNLNSKLTYFKENYRLFIDIPLDYKDAIQLRLEDIYNILLSFDKNNPFISPNDDSIYGSINKKDNNFISLKEKIEELRDILNGEYKKKADSLLEQLFSNPLQFLTTLITLIPGSTGDSELDGIKSSISSQIFKYTIETITGNKDYKYKDLRNYEYTEDEDEREKKKIFIDKKYKQFNELKWLSEIADIEFKIKKPYYEEEDDLRLKKKIWEQMMIVWSNKTAQLSIKNFEIMFQNDIIFSRDPCDIKYISKLGENLVVAQANLNFKNKHISDKDFETLKELPLKILCYKMWFLCCLNSNYNPYYKDVGVDSYSVLPEYIMNHLNYFDDFILYIKGNAIKERIKKIIKANINVFPIQESTISIAPIKYKSELNITSQEIISNLPVLDKFGNRFTNSIDRVKRSNFSILKLCYSASKSIYNKLIKDDLNEWNRLLTITYALKNMIYVSLMCLSDNIRTEKWVIYNVQKAFTFLIENEKKINEDLKSNEIYLHIIGNICKYLTQLDSLKKIIEMEGVTVRDNIKKKKQQLKGGMNETFSDFFNESTYNHDATNNYLSYVNVYDNLIRCKENIHKLDMKIATLVILEIFSEKEKAVKEAKEIYDNIEGIAKETGSIKDTLTEENNENLDINEIQKKSKKIENQIITLENKTKKASENNLKIHNEPPDDKKKTHYEPSDNKTDYEKKLDYIENILNLYKKAKELFATAKSKLGYITDNKFDVICGEYENYLKNYKENNKLELLSEKLKEDNNIIQKFKDCLDCLNNNVGEKKRLEHKIIENIYNETIINKSNNTSKYINEEHDFECKLFLLFRYQLKHDNQTRTDNGIIELRLEDKENDDFQYKKVLLLKSLEASISSYKKFKEEYGQKLLDQNILLDQDIEDKQFMDVINIDSNIQPSFFSNQENSDYVQPEPIFINAGNNTGNINTVRNSSIDFLHKSAPKVGRKYTTAASIVIVSNESFIENGKYIQKEGSRGFFSFNHNEGIKKKAVNILGNVGKVVDQVKDEFTAELLDTTPKSNEEKEQKTYIPDQILNSTGLKRKKRFFPVLKMCMLEIEKLSENEYLIYISNNNEDTYFANYNKNYIRPYFKININSNGCIYNYYTDSLNNVNKEKQFGMSAYYLGNKERWLPFEKLTSSPILSCEFLFYPVNFETLLEKSEQHGFEPSIWNPYIDNIVSKYYLDNIDKNNLSIKKASMYPIKNVDIDTLAVQKKREYTVIDSDNIEDKKEIDEKRFIELTQQILQSAYTENSNDINKYIYNLLLKKVNETGKNNKVDGSYIDNYIIPYIILSNKDEYGKKLYIIKEKYLLIIDTANASRNQSGGNWFFSLFSPKKKEKKEIKEIEEIEVDSNKPHYMKKAKDTIKRIPLDYDKMNNTKLVIEFNNTVNDINIAKDKGTIHWNGKKYTFNRMHYPSHDIMNSHTFDMTEYTNLLKNKQKYDICLALSKIYSEKKSD